MATVGLKRGNDTNYDGTLVAVKRNKYELDISGKNQQLVASVKYDLKKRAFLLHLSVSWIFLTSTVLRYCLDTLICNCTSSPSATNSR